MYISVTSIPSCYSGVLDIYSGMGNLLGDNSQKDPDQLITRSSFFKNRPVFKFILKFLVLLALVGILFSQFISHFHNQMLWLMDLTATLVGNTMSIFSDNVSFGGDKIIFKGFPVEIIDECTGLFEALIFIAAVLAFSTSLKKKLIGITLGVPAIYLFNIMRIIFLLMAGAASQRLFDFMHLYFWQGTLIIMISAVWVGWLFLVVYHEKKSVNISS